MVDPATPANSPPRNLGAVMSDLGQRLGAVAELTALRDGLVIRVGQLKPKLIVPSAGSNPAVAMELENLVSSISARLKVLRVEIKHLNDEAAPLVEAAKKAQGEQP